MNYAIDERKVLNMENIIWLILAGGFFYLMMRKGGCCGGGHSHKNHTDDTEKTLPHNDKTQDKKNTSCH
ncbi:MAG TPA: hypothetical protein ENH23_08115 [candidate division Zixibacteria bacterium]|nr:hypothetical protein [candidate division Zixibacteria bacterium]